MIRGLRDERGPPDPVIQLLQVLTIAIGAPGVNGVIAKVQGAAGPASRSRITTWPSCSTRRLAPDGASWFFLAAPLIAVAGCLTIPLQIPVLTTYGLQVAAVHLGRRH